MTALVIALFVVAAAPGAGPPACLMPGVPPAAGLGEADPFRAPPEAAVGLNADAKKLYRDGKWEAARAKYAAALAADPDFLAPKLNIACSFVRQERFAEAVDEALSLVRRAYVPWAREVLEAADLGALKVRPEMTRVREALAHAARDWGDGLGDALVFVARTRAPLGLKGEGVLVLGPRQEIFAWLPANGRYRQLTAEDGRVLALSRSPDGRRIAYVTAEKLVRGPGAAAALRGVALKILDLGTMSVSEPALVPGDVQRLELGWNGASSLARVRREGGEATFTVESGRLVAGARMRKGIPLTFLGPEGVGGAAPVVFGGRCRLAAADKRAPGVPPAVEVRLPGKAEAPARLATRHGAGLLGLPLGESPPP